MLSPTEKEFKDFSWLLSDFQVLFKADLIFKDFQETPLNSSTFQACKQNFLAQITIFSNPSILAFVLDAQKNRLIETDHLSTLNICFG